VSKVIRLDGREMNASLTMIISVHPEHARNIMAGKKTVELRRRFPQETVVGGLLLIYSSSPDQAILGATRIKAVQRMAIRTLWTKFGHDACVPRSAFFDYFAGASEGFGVILGPVISAKNPIPVSELRDRFSFCPPQSYQYASGPLARIFSDERFQIPDRYKRRNRP
jgi:predicted transcriptional regulator